MSRRIPLVVVLGVALLLPAPASADEESPVTGAQAPHVGAGVPVASVVDGPPVPPEYRPVVRDDFLVGHWELQRLPWNALRLTNRKPVPIRTVGPQDRDGVPLATLRRDGRLVYNPTVIAQQGMKRLDAYRRTGNKVHLRHARRFAEALKRISDGGRQRRWQPHPYDLGVHERGWVNSNSHGLVLSFLSRFHRLTGEAGFLRQARLLFNAFEQRPGNERWFSNVTKGGYLWFEHWPDGDKDHTLNAHVNALFGLYDYWLASGDPRAERYLQGGIRTVRDKLHRFRRKGELSRYSLAGPAGTLHYHETHVAQLRILARMTGDPWFERQADRFERDGRAWKVKYRGARP